MLDGEIPYQPGEFLDMPLFRRAGGKRWRRLSLWAKNRAAWRCESCGKAGRLEAHHRRPLHQGGAMLDPANVRVLCLPCHLSEHRRPKTESENSWTTAVELLRRPPAGKTPARGK